MVSSICRIYPERNHSGFPQALYTRMYIHQGTPPPVIRNIVTKDQLSLSGFLTLARPFGLLWDLSISISLDTAFPGSTGVGLGFRLGSRSRFLRILLLVLFGIPGTKQRAPLSVLWSWLGSSGIKEWKHPKDNVAVQKPQFWELRLNLGRVRILFSAATAELHLARFSIHMYISLTINETVQVFICTCASLALTFQTGWVDANVAAFIAAVADCTNLDKQIKWNQLLWYWGNGHTCAYIHATIFYLFEQVFCDM